MWDRIKNAARGIRGGLPGALTLLGSGLGWLLHRVVGIPELLGSLAGRTPPKKLRLKLLVLRSSDNTPLASTEQVRAVVEAATAAFREQANVVIEPSVGSHEIVAVLAENPSYVLNPKCDWGGFQHNFTRVGRWFRSASRDFTARGGVVVFVVEDVQKKAGCFTGLVDFGYIDPAAVSERSTGGPAEGARQLTLAHELGHGCDLLHRRDLVNLMTPGSSERTARLSRWQRAVLRSSRHVRYR